MLRIIAGAMEYLEDNKGIIFFVFFFFGVSLIAGALLVRFMEAQQLAELNHAFLVLGETLGKQTEEPLLYSTSLLKASFQKNLGLLLLMWLWGYIWFGFPFVLLLMLYKGFSLGFTVSFLVCRWSAQGVLFALLAVLPHNLLFVPAFIGTAAGAGTYSLLKCRERFKDIYFDQKKHSTNHNFFIAVMFLLALLGSIVEAFVTPVFTRLVFLIF